MNAAERICRTNFKYMYWSSVQQLVHHASSGCAMSVGDLLGSGTISGAGKGPARQPARTELGRRRAAGACRAASAARSWKTAIRLKITGWCQGDGYRVGFGEVEGTILPAE